MAEINLLFLAPHWRVSLIRAFQKTSEINHIKGNLIGADNDLNSPTRQILEPFFPIPLFASQNCLEKVLNTASKFSLCCCFFDKKLKKIV